MKLKIFKVHIRYKRPENRPIAEDISLRGSSGHWVVGENKKDALRIAEIYKIGYPMGRDDIESRSIYSPISFEHAKRHCLHGHFKASVWVEENGKLVGYKLPLTEYGQKLIPRLEE